MPKHIPLQTGPLPVSPWRWACFSGTLSWRSRCQRTDSCWQQWWSRCCCPWTPGGWWCLPPRSAGPRLNRWSQELDRRCWALMQKHTHTHTHTFTAAASVSSLHSIHDIVVCLTKVLGGLSKLGQFPDKAWRLLVVGTEGEDSLIGGVGGGAALLAGQRGVVGGEGPRLNREAGGELIVQDPTGRLREWACELSLLLCLLSNNQICRQRWR